MDSDGQKSENKQVKLMLSHNTQSIKNGNHKGMCIVIAVTSPVLRKQEFETKTYRFDKNTIK